MRAVIVDDFGAEPQVKDVPVPTPAPHEVLVRLEASGLCHTDIHAAHGDWPVQPTLPFTPGHEGVGIVEAVGDQVTEVAVGDRVAMPWFGYGCGTCGYCVDGPTGGVCTYACDGTCPPGWECRVTDVDGQLTSVCRPGAFEVCTHCTADDECGAGACVTLEGAGYCLPACLEHSCPPGYTCGADPNGQRSQANSGYIAVDEAWTRKPIQ